MSALDSFRRIGVITAANWTMAPDGETYMYFWCANWRVTTDKEFGDGFRSSERWQLLARDLGGTVLAVFPGCQVKGFSVCHRDSVAAQRPNVYRFEAR